MSLLKLWYKHFGKNPTKKVWRENTWNVFLTSGASASFTGHYYMVKDGALMIRLIGQDENGNEAYEAVCTFAAGQWSRIELVEGADAA